MSGILPKLIPRIAHSKNTLSFLNCFSAGIFLGMALTHMIPEGVHLYADWAKKKNIEKPFPLDYVLIFCGYMLMLTVDKVIVPYLLKNNIKKAEAKLARKKSMIHNNDPGQLK